MPQVLMDPVSSADSGRSSPAVSIRILQPANPKRIVVGALAVLASLAGIEHGVGEIMQGSVRPASLVIESWPDAAAMDILQGEPAMTVVPNLLVSGILTVIVAMMLAIWAVRFGQHRQVAAGLGLLSLLLLLVGGGFGPPLLGAIVAIGAKRPTSGRPGRVGRSIARMWSLLLVAAVVGYVGLMPGTVLLSANASFESAALTSGLSAVAFAGAILALFAVRAKEQCGP